MKKISCGVVLHNGIELLTVHPTHNKRWDIPKGEMDELETPLQTVLREGYEETNLMLPKNSLVHLGLFPYRSEKDLILFEYKVDVLPDISNMKCESTFMWYGKETHEVDNYRYCRFDEIDEYLFPELGRIIKSLELNYNKNELFKI